MKLVVVMVHETDCVNENERVKSMNHRQQIRVRVSASFLGLNRAQKSINIDRDI